MGTTPSNISLDPVTFPIHRLIWRSRYSGPGHDTLAGDDDPNPRVVRPLPLVECFEGARQECWNASGTHVGPGSVSNFIHPVRLLSFTFYLIQFRIVVVRINLFLATGNLLNHGLMSRHNCPKLIFIIQTRLWIRDGR